MDNILFLAHTEADGTLNKAALEALGSAVELKQALNGTLAVALYGAQIQPAADSIAACGATALSCCLRRGLRTGSLCHRCRCLRSPGSRVRRDHRDCRRDLSQLARDGSRRPSSGRMCGHARHRCRCFVWRSDGDPLVLSPAHRRLADPHPASVDSAARSRVASRVEGRAWFRSRQS